MRLILHQVFDPHLVLITSERNNLKYFEHCIDNSDDTVMIQAGSWEDMEFLHTFFVESLGFMEVAYRNFKITWQTQEKYLVFGKYNINPRAFLHLDVRDKRDHFMEALKTLRKDHGYHTTYWGRRIGIVK